jgi:hypothetical protein
MNAEPARVSKSEYARMRGVSSSYVSKLHRQNRLVVDDRGLVIVQMTDTLVQATRDPARGGDRTGKRSERVAHEAQATGNSAAPSAGAGPMASPQSESMSLSEAARSEKIERTRKLRLEVAEQAGQLLRRDAVEAETFKRARQGQEALMALKDRLPPLLASETDERAIDALLDVEFRHVIAVLTGSKSPLQEAA